MLGNPLTELAEATGIWRRTMKDNRNDRTIERN